jgi:hypothetical protein
VPPLADVSTVALHRQNASDARIHIGVESPRLHVRARTPVAWSCRANVRHAKAVLPGTPTTQVVLEAFAGVARIAGSIAPYELSYLCLPSGRP